ncbi:hypothetical protein IJ117_01255 [Candidatus Saccharibacteria bacterium]|nr:hypothetical protein [Candidatus Saccharibacteria bacterium]
MKAKQTLVISSVVTGVLAIFGGFAFGPELVNRAGALKYQDNVDVQFTFNPSMSISFSDDGALDMGTVAPGQIGTASFTITVDNNSYAGYQLSATVGDGTTYTDGRLKNIDENMYIAAIASEGALPTNGSNSIWGYKTGETTYAALPYITDTPVILNKTIDASGTAASGYAGTNQTTFAVGAYVSDGQAAGEYSNLINFTATAQVIARTITVANGTNGTGASITKVGDTATSANTTSGAYETGTVLTIAGSCNSGYTFAGWEKSGDYGFVDLDNGVYTYTVGHNDATLTSVCVADN